MPEQWVPLTQAAKICGVSAGKLSTMVKLGRIKSKKDPRDERLTLLDLEELRHHFKIGGKEE